MTSKQLLQQLVPAIGEPYEGHAHRLPSSTLLARQLRHPPSLQSSQGSQQSMQFWLTRSSQNLAGHEQSTFRLSPAQASQASAVTAQFQHLLEHYEHTLTPVSKQRWEQGHCWAVSSFRLAKMVSHLLQLPGEPEHIKQKGSHLLQSQRASRQWSERQLKHCVRGSFESLRQETQSNGLRLHCLHSNDQHLAWNEITEVVTYPMTAPLMARTLQVSVRSSMEYLNNSVEMWRPLETTQLNLIIVIYAINGYCERPNISWVFPCNLLRNEILVWLQRKGIQFWGVCANEIYISVESNSARIDSKIGENAIQFHATFMYSPSPDTNVFKKN